MLNFLQHEHLRLRTVLVQRRSRRDGSVREFVTKKDLIDRGVAPREKDFLASFTKAHPQVFADFKQAVRGTGRSIRIEDFDGVDVSVVCEYLENRLKAIPGGRDTATDYHRTAVGILDFLFYPHLMNPLVEKEIHEGRKRIDFTFDNAATAGFFLRLSEVCRITCPFILCECKNYSRDPTNPEPDQLAGRFGPNRGQFGLLVCRTIEDHEQFLTRCGDTLKDSRGLILPLTDEDLIAGLRQRAVGDDNPLDSRLTDFYRAVALR